MTPNIQPPVNGTAKMTAKTMYRDMTAAYTNGGQLA